EKAGRIAHKWFQAEPWESDHLRYLFRVCSTFTRTWLGRFQLTLRRHDSSAIRRYPASQPRTMAPLLSDEHGYLFGASVLGEQAGLFCPEEGCDPCRERLPG